MVMKLITVVFLALYAWTVHADIEKQPTHKHLNIQGVIIDENAAWSDAVSSNETPDSCRDFLLTETDVRQFFKEARNATSPEYNHDLLMSRCYSSGRATLQDGREIGWEIDRARRGIVIFPDRTAVFFFCAKCTSKAYGEACDIDCIHAP
jgi:hypothetical protein